MIAPLEVRDLEYDGILEGDYLLVLVAEKQLMRDRWGQIDPGFPFEG